MASTILLRGIYWSFARETPASPDELISDAEDYHAGIHAPFRREDLTSKSPFKRMDVRYSFGTWVKDEEMEDGGYWTDKSLLIMLGDGEHRLTYAEILWAVHSMAFENLSDQDHHYFEGLKLLDTEYNPGVPAFEVVLGS